MRINLGLEIRYLIQRGRAGHALGKHAPLEAWDKVVQVQCVKAKATMLCHSYHQVRGEAHKYVYRLLNSHGWAVQC